MATVKSLLTFEEAGLAGVLKRYTLRVPPNQREYAWGDPEVPELLNDFTAAVDEDGEYFVGTLVTVPREPGTLEVADGQQRLATTSLLIAVIRDALLKLDEPDIAGSVETDFLAGFDRDKRVAIPKLTLNVDDHELFTRIIARSDDDGPGEPMRSSHRKLLFAKEQARQQIQRVIAPYEALDRANVLNRWLKFLEFRAVVALLQVADAAKAYKMFETLNDRGLEVSQADLVKNHLFAQAGTRAGEVQNSWSYMRGALESTSDDPRITITFIRHAQIVQNGHVREADVYDRVQAAVRSEAHAATFGVTLESLANIYVSTFNPEHERWNTFPAEARRAIEVFNLFDIKPMRPLILAIAHRMDRKQAALAFKLLIAVGVRLIIATGTRTSSVEIPLATTAKGVYDGDLETAESVRKALELMTPSDSVFRNAFVTAKVSNARLARYYLRSLERAAKGEADPYFIPQDDATVINLEHVLPKKPEDNWPTFSDEQVGDLATRLGNQALMLAKQNSDIRSAGFSKKKKLYATSSYHFTSQIASVDEWTEEAIDARQKQMATYALTAWPATI